MVKTLYVGNLPWTATNDQLVQAFEAQAPILSARVITDRETGRSKGFGFIEVADEDAEKVIKAMSGASIAGRPVTVSEARPKQKG